MEDKPMAWMDKYNAVIPASHKYFQPELLKDYDIPLYTQECWENKFKQQQAEIEALKKEAALQRLSDFTQEADNEPVAWINQNIDVENLKTKSARQSRCEEELPHFHLHIKFLQ